MHSTMQHILTRLDGVRESASGYEARCPAHDDRRASLSIARGDDGRVLLHCHAGCTPVEICSALGLKLVDLFASDGRRNGSRIVATYDYRDASGKIVYQIVRFEPKDFRARRPDGNGGWEWRLAGAPRVLYRLPDILAANPDDIIFVVEGEKDADRLSSVGLVATCNPGGAGKWARLSDDSALCGRHVVVIADKDQPGRAHAADVAARLRGRAASVRVIELPGPGKDASDWFDAGGTADELLRIASTDSSVAAERVSVVAEQNYVATERNSVATERNSVATERGPVTAGRPEIIIDHDEYVVVRKSIEALRNEADIYQRGGVLVHTLRDDDGRLAIRTLPQACLRERLTRAARFMRHARDGDLVPAHPTTWLVGAVDAHGEYHGIRRLAGISDLPVVRPDGSVWMTPGYDATTGVLYEPPCGADSPTIGGDANTALDTLLEVICDFPFEAREHQSAWLAALLTPLARFAFRGPAPLFLVDANVRGAGKSLLVQIISMIVTGREAPVSSYSRDAEEMRKKITTIVLFGERLAVLDNISGSLGDDVLDRALTCSRWTDRLLGRNDRIDLPMTTTWYATGNNVRIAADTMRRTIHIRLDCLCERPEERTGFRHDNLMSWVAENRIRLASAALTILAAQAGRQQPSLAPYGGYEGWSSVVRAAVVGAGMPDPCHTRSGLESADDAVESLAQLLDAWSRYDSDGRGLVVADLLVDLYPPRPDDGPARFDMRVALETLTGTTATRPPTARQVGYVLRRYRRRVVGRRFLDCEPTKSGALWMLKWASFGDPE